MALNRHIAAVVLHFRTPECTFSCLRSLRDEGVTQVIVVDNSEDQGKSLASMQQGLDSLRASGLRVNLITPTQNLGFARGIDAGLEKLLADGPMDVLLINSDARLERGALSQMVATLVHAAIVVPRVRKYANSTTSALFGFYHSLFGLVLHKWWWGSVRYPSGCCLLIREDYIQRGLFDKDFFFYGEDVMLGFDLQRRGIAVAECAEAVVMHEGSASAKNGSMFYEYHMNRGHWLLAGKLARNKLECTMFICMRCVTLPLRATVRSARFRSPVPWKGLFAATADVVRRRCRNFTPPAKHPV